MVSIRGMRIRLAKKFVLYKQLFTILSKFWNFFSVVGLDSFGYRFIVTYVAAGINDILYSAIFSGDNNFDLRMSVVLMVTRSISFTKFNGVSLSSWYSPKYFNHL